MSGSAPAQAFADRLAALRSAMHTLPDKPEETPEATLRALWHLAGADTQTVPGEATDRLLPQRLSAMAAQRLHDADAALPPLDTAALARLDGLVSQRLSGIPLAHLTGRQAYERYAEGVTALVAQLGGSVRFSGDVSGILLGEVEELWDVVALVEYPSYDAFLQMTLSPEYQAIEHHRIAGLAGQLNIRTKPGF